jgi:hypothetical protein
MAFAMLASIMVNQSLTVAASRDGTVNDCFLNFGSATHGSAAPSL